MTSNDFKRNVNPSEIDEKVLIDSELKNSEYVESFGFEWTQIDGFIEKKPCPMVIFLEDLCCHKIFSPIELLLMLGVVMVGLEDWLLLWHKKYYGLDLSESVYAFPKYLESGEHYSSQGKRTDLPLNNGISDVTICWGVLHHMNEPMKGLNELVRVTKPGGSILIFIYSKAYRARKNLNEFAKNISQEKGHELLESVSDCLDSWREVDQFYANNLSRSLFMSVKQSRDWQIFQWYDGITPQYHWDLEEEIESAFKKIV